MSSAEHAASVAQAAGLAQTSAPRNPHPDAVVRAPQLLLPLSFGRLDMDSLFGANNVSALAACRDRVASNEPLWLHGPNGTGKSHLLRTLGEQLAASGRQVQLLTADAPANRTWQMAASGLDAVLIDDVQQWAGARDAEEALFALINHQVHDLRRLLVLSADKPATQLPWRVPDVASRVAQWTSVALSPLTDDELLIALGRRSEANGLALDPAIGPWLLTHVSRDQGLLLDLMDALADAALSEKRRLTIQFIRQNWRNLSPRNHR